MYYEAMHVARKTEREISRSAYKILKYNVELFYTHFNNGNFRAITGFIENLCKGVVGDLELEAFLQGFKKVIPEFGFLADAVNSRKPIVGKIYKQIMTGFHLAVKNSFEKNWNQQFHKIGAGECKLIAENLAMYADLFQKWSFKDIFFGDWEKPVIQTFLNHLFENSKELICNMLNDLKQSSYIQNDKIYSRSIDNFESHLNFVVDHYKAIPSIVCARELSYYCGNLIGNFMMNVLTFIRTESLTFELCIMFMNANFIKIIKGIEKRISDMTKSQLTLPQIKLLMNDDFLFYMLRRLYNVGLEKTKAKAAEIVSAKFDSISFIMDMQFKEQMLKEIKKEFGALIAKIVNTNIIQDIFQSVFEQIVKSYILLFLRDPAKVTPQNYPDLLSKIQGDFQAYTEDCTPEVIPNADDYNTVFKSFVSFLSSKDIDVAIVALMKIQAYYPMFEDEKLVLALANSKMNISPANRTYIAKFLLDPRAKIRSVVSKYQVKMTPRKAFTCSILTIVFILKTSSIIRINDPSKEEIQRATSG